MEEYYKEALPDEDEFLKIIDRWAFRHGSFADVNNIARSFLARELSKRLKEI
jgi:hypothetical protein